MNDSRFKCIRKKISVHVYVLESSLQYYILFSLFCLSFGLLALFDLHLHTFFCRFIRVSSLLQHFIPFCQSICFLLTKIIYFNKVRQRRFGGKEKLIFLLFPITYCSFSFPIVLQSYAKFLLQRQTKQLQILMVSWKSPKPVFYFLI